MFQQQHRMRYICLTICGDFILCDFISISELCWYKKERKTMRNHKTPAVIWKMSNVTGVQWNHLHLWAARCCQFRCIRSNTGSVKPTAPAVSEDWNIWQKSLIVCFRLLKTKFLSKLLYFKWINIWHEWMLLRVDKGAEGPGSQSLRSIMSLRPLCPFPFFLYFYFGSTERMVQWNCAVQQRNVSKWLVFVLLLMLHWAKVYLWPFLWKIGSARPCYFVDSTFVLCFPTGW